jgi:hypothetical protein
MMDPFCFGIQFQVEAFMSRSSAQKIELGILRIIAQRSPQAVERCPVAWQNLIRTQKGAVLRRKGLVVIHPELLPRTQRFFLTEYRQRVGHRQRTEEPRTCGFALEVVWVRQLARSGDASLPVAKAKDATE